MGISQGTADQDAGPDLAPMTEAAADTLALDLQETDVMTGIATIEEDHQTTAEMTVTVTTDDQADGTTAIVPNADVTVQTVRMIGVVKIEVGAQ